MFRHPFQKILLVASFLVFGLGLGAAPEPKERTTEGTVLQAGDAQLILKVSATSVIQRFNVATDAVIRRDGREVKLNDVKLGDIALVSAKGDQPIPTATAISALSPQQVARRE